MYSLDTYRRLLDFARDRGYHVAGFADSPAGRTLWLRHDVDYSLGMAVELARVNHASGVRGTFCVLLRGQVYNLLSESSLRQVQELLDLDQRIALHVAVPDPPPADLADYVAADFAILRRHVPSAEPVFAWHNPTPGLIERTRGWEPAGLVNAYHRRFVADVPYFSDSNLRNSVADFERVLTAGHDRLHLLLHPLNWVAGGASMAEIFAGTWPYVLREREEEFRGNRVYRELFPDGMPADVVQGFARQWRRAAG